MPGSGHPIVLRRGLFGLLLLGGLCLAAPLTAQNQTAELEKRLQELETLRQNPLYQQLFGQQDGLSADQKAVLNQAIDKLEDAELTNSLERLGLNKSGNLIARRLRLKMALGLVAKPEFPAPAKAGDIAIENASEGEYIQGAEDGRGMLKLQGRIRVRTPEGTFKANLVIIDSERQEIYGEGDVVFESERATITAERIIYNKKLHNGIIYNAAGIANPVFVIGKSIRQIRENRFTASDAWFTSNAARIPHYHFTARRIWLYEDNTVFAAGVWYHVGGVPLLPLPFLYASDWGTGIISQIGHSDVQGWFWENTYRFSDPDAVYSSWRPSSWKFKADWHENLGELFGIEVFRYSPNLNYFIDLDVARFKRYEIIGDFRERDNIAVTNQVRRDDGTIGADERRWYKIFALVNFRMNNREHDMTRNLYLRFEDYSHPLFDYEFGGRYEPDNTAFALYKNSEAGRGLLHTNTNWQLTYNETRGDLNVRVSATRNQTWNVQTGYYDDGEYDPVSDVAPEVDISHQWLLGHLPVAEMPLYWTHLVHTDLTREYSLGKDFKNNNHNQYETAFYSYTALYPWISFEPRVGYGIQKTIPQNLTGSATDDTTQTLEARKNSYQYVFSETKLTFGPDELSLGVTHRLKDSFKEDQNDAPVVNITGFTGNQKTNETEFELQTKPWLYTQFSLNAIYDHREFTDDIESRERWSYPIFRSDIFYDFLNPAQERRENLLSRNKIHFLQLHLTNDYIYDPFYKRDHSNVAGVTFEMGGFDLWLLERLRYLEFSYYWYHVYFDPALDHMRYSMKLDLQLWEWGYLEMELESRATDIERYSGSSKDEDGISNHVNFTRDIANGLGLNGRQKREDAVFNVASFETALILDVEDFEYRIGYEMSQKSMFAGNTSLELVTYYDNRIFFSLSFLKFNLRNNGSDGSRYWLNRTRVRPGDVGSQPIQFQ
ncbi:MAG: hypothetical protein KDK39_08040 [Leptospiraceae bacterium]|nr:hypothetical protein [Leptospiraceae bacterium]